MYLQFMSFVHIDMASIFYKFHIMAADFPEAKEARASAIIILT